MKTINILIKLALSSIALIVTCVLLVVHSCSRANATPQSSSDYSFELYDVSDNSQTDVSSTTLEFKYGVARTFKMVLLEAIDYEIANSVQGWKTEIVNDKITITPPSSADEAGVTSAEFDLKVTYMLNVVNNYKIAVYVHSAEADRNEYLKDLKGELNAKWPNNRTINLVFHGHSVPSGYAATPLVKTLEAYPQQVLSGLKDKYPYAVINVIVTAIGGETAIKGAARFETDVLNHKPDVLFIDYALNDTPNNQTKAAWGSMIEAATAQGIKVILLTPTPDLRDEILSESSFNLNKARMIRSLAEEYKVGLADSFARFREIAEKGEDLSTYMAQKNHPNKKGHTVVAEEILKWF